MKLRSGGRCIEQEKGHREGQGKARPVILHRDVKVGLSEEMK